MSTFGNLLVAGVASGAIYALFAACVAVWFRVCNVLNLAVGDFAMLGAIGTAELCQAYGVVTPVAILGVLVATGVVAWLFDWLVLHVALDGRRGHSGIVAILFYTFALSFILEGAAKVVFGTNAHAAPALWPGAALTVGGLHIQRAAILIMVLAVVSGLLLGGYLRLTVAGKAASACGESMIGSRIVGIDAQRLRRRIFVMTAVLAALFGIVESPITGFVYNTGPTISLIGVVAAGFAGFRRPGRAVVIGLGIGVVEALLGGYVSTQYSEVILYGLLAGVLILWPEVLGMEALTQ
ncbi:MAG TPA: branched-chain amino acid ABC transporter permease [Acidimicrobiales bacterium]|nr:branched-chain amino acid ABC transporter permease [Acidimicrobiales bacterium]